MLYYNAQFDRLGLLTDIDGYAYLEIDNEGLLVIPFTRERWKFVGAL